MNHVKIASLFDFLDECAYKSNLSVSFSESMLSPLWLTSPYTEFLVSLGCAALSGDIDEGWFVADLYIGHETSFSLVTMSTSEYQSSVSV